MSELKGEVIVHFVDIGGIVDHNIKLSFHKQLFQSEVPSTFFFKLHIFSVTCV